LQHDQLGQLQPLIPLAAAELARRRSDAPLHRLNSQHFNHRK